MNRIALLILLSAIVFSANGQSIGDYQTDPDGFLDVTVAWSDRTEWVRWDGNSWEDPTAGEGYPGQFSVPGRVTILSFNFATLDVNLGFNIGNIDIQNLASIDVSGNRNLTVNGVLDLQGGASFFTFSGNGNLTVSGATQNDGFLTEDSNPGTSTFVGLVTNTGTWTSTQ